MFENLSRYYYNKGLKEARERQISLAVRSLASAVSFDSKNCQAWNLAGLCHYRLGSYKTARWCWQKSMELQPAANGAAAYLDVLEQNLQLAETSLNKVASLAAQKKYREAARILQEEICSRFDFAAALYNYLGVLQVLGGKPGEAAQCWESVLKIDSGNAAAERYLAALERSFGYRWKQFKKWIFQRLKTGTDRKR